MTAINLTRSLNLYLIANTLRGFWLGHIISIIYAKYVGLNDVSLAYYHLWMGILTSVGEIPTGVLADRLGYRLSILLSYVALTLAFISHILSAFSSPWVFILISPIFFSLHSTLLSGASQAYIYSLLSAQNQDTKYPQYVARLEFFSLIARSAAVISGGYLYLYAPYLPYTFQACLMLIASILVFMLEKEPIHSAAKKLSTSRAHLNQAWRLYWSQPIVPILFIFLFLSTASYQMFDHLINQSYWLEKGYEVQKIAWLGLGAFLCTALITRFLGPAMNRISLSYSLPILATISGLLPIGLWLAQDFWLIVLLSGAVYGVGLVTEQSIQYRVLQSSQAEFHASILSIGSMLVGLAHKCIMIGVAYLFGWINYSQSLGLLGLVFGVLAFSAAISIRRKADSVFC